MPASARRCEDGFAGFGVEGDAEAEGRARVGVVGSGHAEVHDVAWPSLPERFSVFQTCWRKRLMRPSSRPFSIFLFRKTFSRPGLRFGSRYLASSLRVLGQSCQ